MGPIYHRIHLGLGISPELPWQNASVTNSFFRDHFLPQKGPRARMSTRGSKMFFHVFWKKFGTGQGRAHIQVRLQKLVCLLKFWQRDLYICPFGDRKPFSTQSNRQIQDWRFPRFLQCKNGRFLYSRTQGSRVPRTLVSVVPGSPWSKNTRFL